MTDKDKGIHIKEARKAKGFTQKELALMLGCSHTTISKYEQGEIENMPLPRMKRLAAILDASPVFLFGLAEENEKEPAIADGLSEDQKELINIIPTLDPDRVSGLLALLRGIRE